MDPGATGRIRRISNGQRYCELFPFLLERPLGAISPVPMLRENSAEQTGVGAQVLPGPQAVGQTERSDGICRAFSRVFSIIQNIIKFANDGGEHVLFRYKLMDGF